MFDKVTSVEIVRDINTLTDVCTIVLPRKVKWKGEQSIPIGRGDEVTIRLGYDGELQTAFRGFITTLGLKSPIKISCEDYLFKIKQIATQKKAYKSATVDQILKDQPIGIPHRVFGEQTIGQYRVRAETISGLLSDLKDHARIRSFILLENDQPVLYSGFIFEQNKQHKQVFDNQKNMIDDTQLKVQTAADVKIKIKAISILPNNKRIHIDIGDSDGDIRVVHAYNKQAPELRAWAEQELKRLKQDGLTGSFTAFGACLLDKLDNVGIIIDGEKKGVYQVERNKINYSSEGFRQEITIGQKMTD